MGLSVAVSGNQVPAARDAGPMRSVRLTSSATAGRNRTLDGIRGVAALTVFVVHCFDYNGVDISFGGWFHPGIWAVWIFFALSGCVLAPAYRGPFIGFMAKRFVRLWPLYAVCMAAGMLLTGAVPPWTRFLWWPMMNAGAPDAIDPPAWSLHIEWWAMFAMPLIALARRGLIEMLLLIAASLALVFILSPWCIYGIFFAAGAWASRFHPRARWLENAAAAWLGRISYPLYLSHYLVLEDCGLPLWAAIPAAVATAHILTVTVEQWSILASRRAGAWVTSAVRAVTAAMFQYPSGSGTTGVHLPFFTTDRND